VVADLGYEDLQLTPHRDFIPFFNHPRADDELVAKLRNADADAGVGVASVLPVLRWSGPDEDAREAAVRNWKRVIQITVDLDVNVINTEFSGRPERAEESERAFFRDEFFRGLAEIGFYDRLDTLMVSSIFAEDENADEVSRCQLAAMTDYITKYR
jgi:sugar phosphate isomerase/epimerase